MKHVTGDALAVKETTSPVIGNAVSQAEGSKAEGYYIATMTGPVEERRQEYIELRDQIAEIESKGLITRLLLSSRLEVLQSKLAAIPTEVKWVDEVHNLVTTVGKNNILDNHLSGSAYTAAWYLGLIRATGYTTGPAAGDTMATHSGWTESVAYSNAARATTAWSAAAAGSKALSAGAVFNINATDTIKGCFLNSIATKSGTTGTLYSAGLFTDGDQPVVNGNTLTVTYTASV